MSKSIGIIELTRLISNAPTHNYECDKCLWGKDKCHKIDGCSIATTIRLLVGGGYLEIKKRKKKGGEE